MAPLPPLTHTHAISAPCGSRFIHTFCVQNDFDRLPVSPFFYISIVSRYTYWSLLLHPLPRSGLYQKGIIQGFLFVNIFFFGLIPFFLSSFLPLQLLPLLISDTSNCIDNVFALEEP